MNYSKTGIIFLTLLLIGCYMSRPVNKKYSDVLIIYQFTNFTGQYYQTMEIPKFIIQANGYTFLKIPAILEDENNEKKPDTSYSYYLFHKDYNYGFYKKNFLEDSDRIIAKDSFFSKQLYYDLENLNLKLETNYTFLNSYVEDGLTVNKYCVKKGMDSSYSDTSLLYFDNTLKDIDFSLDKRLDPIHHSKFVKRRALYYNKIKDSPLFGIVYLEISISFKPGNYHTQAELDYLIATFKQFNSAKNSNRDP
jgi:hypothetical protein